MDAERRPAAGPAVTGYTAFRGIFALYSERLDRIRVQVSRRHVVVAGATAAGTAVARTLVRSGRRVVLVDPSLTVERVASLRSVGVLTVTGDPARPEVLHLARAHRAKEVVALTDDDARNVDVTLRARQLAERDGQPIRTLGSVSRSDICELLRIEALGSSGAATTDFFDAAELTARAVTRALAAHGSDGDLVVRTPAATAIALTARLRRTGFTGRVILEGPDAAATAAELERRLGADEQRVVATASPGVHGARRAVVAGSGSAALADALDLARRLPIDGVVVAVLPDPGHLAPLATGSATGRAPIEVVDALAWWRDPDLVLLGAVEVIARATHQGYQDMRRADGTFDATDPSLVPWEQLSPTLRESNRDQARHAWVKLAAVGCALAPAGLRDEPFAFSADEVELLARMEHDRWVAERRANGWRPGPRDTQRKTTRTSSRGRS